MKAIQELANLLDETAWGKHFERDEILTISKYMGLQFYKDGDSIFRQGDRNNYMAFIIDGAVNIVKESNDNRERVVVSLAQRTHFGEMSFVDNEPRSASAVAQGETTLLVLTLANFEKLLDDHPKIGIKILKNIAKMISQRLRMTTGKLVYVRP